MREGSSLSDPGPGDPALPACAVDLATLRAAALSAWRSAAPEDKVAGALALGAAALKASSGARTQTTPPGDGSDTASLGDAASTSGPGPARAQPACAAAPERPGRPARPRLVPPRQVPRRSMAGEAGRAALVHAIAHIELNAIDLALDAVWRFEGMPASFACDWASVAADEARHFTLLRELLRRRGFDYGDFDAHDGLWDMAQRTAGDVLARMAMVPRVMEARGLDATPPIQHKLRQAGDAQAAQVLQVILDEEVGHVAIGNRWFRWLCAQRGLEPLAAWTALMREHGAARTAHAMNRPARIAAGFTPSELAALQDSPAG